MSFFHFELRASGIPRGWIGVLGCSMSGQGVPKCSGMPYGSVFSEVFHERIRDSDVEQQQVLLHP